MASRKIQEYPHCDLLIYTIATVLNGSLTLSDPVSYTHLDVYKRQGVFLYSKKRIVCKIIRLETVKRLSER